MNSKPKKILIIRFSAMGDVVLTFPVIQNLLKKYPETQITILTNSFFHPFFEGIPSLNLYPVDLKGKHKGIFGLRKLVNELTRSYKYDVIIDLHAVIRSWIISIFFKLRGIPVYRIDKGRKEKKAFLKNPFGKALSHTTERYQAVFQKAGFDFSLHRTVLPKTATTERLKEFETHLGLINIGIAPFAAHASKEWGTANIQALIEGLNKKYTLQIFLFGGGKEEVKKLDVLATNFTNVFNVAGKFSLREEIQILQKLSVFIGMDSGNMHLASLAGIPVISIWGGTHPGVGFSALYQPQENSIQPDIALQKKCKLSVFGTSEPQLSKPPYFCIQTIKPQLVIDRIVETLHTTSLP